MLHPQIQHLPLDVSIYVYIDIWISLELHPRVYVEAVIMHGICSRVCTLVDIVSRMGHEIMYVGGADCV